MEQAQFEIDTEQVMKMFAEFNDKERKKTFKSAIMKSLQIVKKQTLTNLENVISPSKITAKDQWGQSFKSGITTKVWKNREGGTIAILKNFKLKFYELGTKDRFNKTWKGRRLKKAKFTGAIKAYHYFKIAKEQTETKVFSNIENIIAQQIIRINKKHRK